MHLLEGCMIYMAFLNVQHFCLNLLLNIYHLPTLLHHYQASSTKLYWLSVCEVICVWEDFLILI